MVDQAKVKSRVLVVDDEESLRLTFERFLVQDGYGAVTVVSTLEEALRLIETTTFDLIISDIVLEGASGIKLLQRVKELKQECPVILMTGYPNITSASDAVRLGAFDYLSKPVNKEELLGTARTAFNHYTLLKEARLLEFEKECYRQKLETIFTSVKDIIITIDQDLEVTLMNKYAKEFSEKFLPGLKVGAKLQNIDNLSVQAWVKDALEALESKEELPDHCLQFQTPDGPLVLRMSVIPLGLNSIHLDGVVFVVREMGARNI